MGKASEQSEFPKAAPVKEKENSNFKNLDANKESSMNDQTLSENNKNKDLEKSEFPQAAPVKDTKNADSQLPESLAVKENPLQSQSTTIIQHTANDNESRMEIAKALTNEIPPAEAVKMPVADAVKESTNAKGSPEKMIGLNDEFQFL